MPPGEPVFCTACGTINAPASARMAELTATVAQLGIEVSRKAGQIKRMRKEQSDEHPPEYDDAMKVAVYWKELLAPRTRELNGPRLKCTIDRLQHGYEVAELQRSIWGYACRPNIKDAKRVREEQGGARYVDLALLMRDAKRVDKGLEIADEEDRFDQSYLASGASRYVAGLCDCGHARGSHALPSMHGHEACLEKGCDCREFDDIYWQMDDYRRRQDERCKRSTPVFQSPPIIPSAPQTKLAI